MKKRRFFWTAFLLTGALLLPVFSMDVMATEVVSEAEEVSAAESAGAEETTETTESADAVEDIGAVEDIDAGKNNAAAPTGRLVSIPLFNEPQSLRLPRNITSFWFRIPSGTVFGDQCSVTLVMSAAETLLEDYSTVTLFLDNVQLATASIVDIIENKGGEWTVSIPVEHLKTDGSLNELRIVTAQRSILGECADIDNPANWVRLEKSSRLNLEVLQMGEPLLGDVLPYMFDGIDQHNQTRAEFILPQGSDNNVRSAMLNVAFAIGAAFPAKDTVQFAVSEDSSAGAESNRIYIGLGSQLPQEMAPAPAVAEENGYLSVARNNDYNDLFLYGVKPTGLAKASAFFTHSEYLTQLSGTSADISTDLQGLDKQVDKHEDGYYTLADFGYSTINLAGAFHQEITYTIEQPQSIRSGSDSYVEIHFRHSTALVADTSLLTVYINDVAINSIQLSDSNSQGGVVRAKIPADALDKSAINIKVDCYNYLGKVDCSKDYYDTAWTVIDEDSVVYFEPGSNSIAPTVRQFPVFDADTGEAAPQAILLMPEAASKTMVEAATVLVCRAGQNSGLAYRWDYTSSLNDKSKEAADLLIMGSNSNVVIPSEVAQLLHILPQNGGFELSGTSHVSAEALQDKIVIQVVRSPWNFYRKVYVVTFPDGMEKSLKQFVSERSNLNELDGAAVLIDAAGTVTAIESDSIKEPDKVPVSMERAVGRLVRITGIPRIGLLIIALLVLVIVVVMIRASRNRRRFEDARKKMDIINADAGKMTEDKPDDPEEDDFDLDKDVR